VKCNVVVGKASAHNELICKFSNTSLMKNDFSALVVAAELLLAMLALFEVMAE
jgi:hypothetical protein